MTEPTLTPYNPYDPATGQHLNSLLAWDIAKQGLPERQEKVLLYVQHQVEAAQSSHVGVISTEVMDDLGFDHEGTGSILQGLEKDGRLYRTGAKRRNRKGNWCDVYFLAPPGSKPRWFPTDAEKKILLAKWRLLNEFGRRLGEGDPPNQLSQTWRTIEEAFEGKPLSQDSLSVRFFRFLEALERVFEIAKVQKAQRQTA